MQIAPLTLFEGRSAGNCFAGLKTSQKGTVNRENLKAIVIDFIEK